MLIRNSKAIFSELHTVYLENIVNESSHLSILKNDDILEINKNEIEYNSYLGWK